MKEMNPFSLQLRRVAKERGWSIADLARQCRGLAEPGQMHEYWSGRHTPRRKKAQKIAIRLGFELPRDYRPWERWNNPKQTPDQLRAELARLQELLDAIEDAGYRPPSDSSLDLRPAA